MGYFDFFHADTTATRTPIIDPAKMDAVKAAAVAAGPCVIEQIQAYDKWKAPTFFECTSGVLLWGQLTTVMEGSLATELDTTLGPYQTNEPSVDNVSTILTHGFRFRALARKGLWKVEAVFYPGGTEPVGYVCHHVDANGPDLVRRVALVGIAHKTHHEDPGIVYVNRYDWARHGCPNFGYQLMKKLMKEEKPPKPEKKTTPAGGEDEEEDDLDEEEDENEEDKDDNEEEEEFSEEYTDEEEEDRRIEYEETLMANRFMLVDEHGFAQLAQSLRYGFKPEAKNYLFRDNRQGSIAASATQLSCEPSSSSDAFGVNLVVGDTGFELGWMAFENGELVGFVYDGVDCELEGTALMCGDTEVEVPRPPESDYEDESESEEQTPSISPPGACTSGASIRLCYNCGNVGHFARDCGRHHGQIARDGAGYGQTARNGGGYGDGGYGQTARNCGGYGDVAEDFGSDDSIAEDCDGYGHMARDLPKHQKRKRGRPQNGQRKVRNCDYCHQDGHTEDRCFRLYPELIAHCDYCHQDGHTEDRCFHLYPELRAHWDYCRQDESESEEQTSSISPPGASSLKSFSKKNTSGGSTRVCYNCGNSGHIARDCGRHHGHIARDGGGYGQTARNGGGYGDGGSGQTPRNSGGYGDVAEDFGIRDSSDEDCGVYGHIAGDLGGCGHVARHDGGYGQTARNCGGYGDVAEDFGSFDPIDEDCDGYGQTPRDFGGCGHVTRNGGGYGQTSRNCGGYGDVAEDFASYDPIDEDCGGYGHIARDIPKHQERKRGRPQTGQRMVRHCDYCRQDGHTEDRCFRLYPELREHCDYCHQDGHTEEWCFHLYPELRAQMRQRSW